MTERELQVEVERLAAKLGVLIHHCLDGRRCEGVGFPDVVACGLKGTIFRELKLEAAELGSQQRMWKWKLLASGADYGIWRPSDLRSGRIEKELQRIA